MVDHFYKGAVSLMNVRNQCSNIVLDASMSRLRKLDLVYFIFSSCFYFIFDLFFHFLFLEQLRLEVIDHTDTSVTI